MHNSDRHSLHYFAYGSNLHPARLIERAPSAILLDTCTLPGHRLAFHKKSEDKSGKCDIINTGLGSDIIHGALYSLTPGHKAALDSFENKGKGYIDARISLNLHGSTVECFTYYAQDFYIQNDLKPYHWYKSLVVLGARFHKFPGYYIAQLENVESVDDSNTERTKEHETLIEKINRYSL